MDVVDDADVPNKCCCCDIGAVDCWLAAGVVGDVPRDGPSGDFGLLIRRKNFAIGFGFDFVVDTTRRLRLHADELVLLLVVFGNILYACSGTSRAVLFGGGFI